MPPAAAYLAVECAGAAFDAERIELPPRHIDIDGRFGPERFRTSARCSEAKPKRSWTALSSVDADLSRASNDPRRGSKIAAPTFR